MRLAVHLRSNYHKNHNYRTFDLTALSPSHSGFRVPSVEGASNPLGPGGAACAAAAREAGGLAAEVIDLFESGGFSWWEWDATANSLSTRGVFHAETLEEWLLRVHPRDQAAFSEFIDQDWALAPSYCSIDYRIQASRKGDWMRVRHTAGLATRREGNRVSGMVEELSSPHLTRTLLERIEGELREGEARVQRFIEAAVSLDGPDPLPLLELLRTTLRSDTVALVRLDARLLPAGVVESSLESVSFPYDEMRPLFAGILATPSPDGFDGVVECDLERPASPLAWLSIRPVRVGGGRVAGALCAGFRSASARTAARRFRSLLSLSSALLAERVGREQEEGQRRDLLAQLREAQRLSGLGRVTGGFAHDLKNLLTLIEGHLHLLDEAFASGDSKGGRDSLRQIRKASEQANELSGRLLLFGGKPATDLRTCDLNRLVERFAAMMRRVLEENIELRLDLDPSVAPVRADEGMLRQILLNLLVDARDAMPRGGRVTLSTRDGIRLENDAAAYVSLTIDDEGGLSPGRRLPGLPAPFSRGVADPTGSGLGHYLVASIVGELGGRVDHPATNGRGNRIRLLFPAYERGGDPETAVPPAVRAPVRRASEGSLKGATILLVEDEAAVRKLVRKLLEVIGCVVVEAVSGREALELWPALRDRVSLVVSDIVMPDGVSGWDLAKELHRRHPDLGILLTSGYSELPVDHGLGGIRQIEFLQKPYGAGALKTALARLSRLSQE